MFTDDINRLMHIFIHHGFEIRIVGGAVRDYLRRVVPKDIDFCTNATPDEMMAIASAHNFHVIPTGIEHGTLTFVIRGEPYEITTLRTDVSTDGRRATVAFTQSFKEDAERRDFTFNAMSMDVQGNLYDYFDGERHLKEGKIVFVGNAEDRIHEDYLRVLRYFRFFARFGKGNGFPTEIRNLFAQPWVSEGMKMVSKERIWAELKKTFVAANAENFNAVTEALTQMKGFTSWPHPLVTAMGLKYVEPFFDNTLTSMMKSYTNLIEHAPNIKDEIDEMFTLYVLNSVFKFDDMLKENEHLPFLSTKERKTMETNIVSGDRVSAFYAQNLMDGYKNVHYLAINLGRWNKTRVLDEDGKIIFAEGYRPFTITGKDIMARGIKPGIRIGQIMEAAKVVFCSSNIPTSSDDVILDYVMGTAGERFCRVVETERMEGVGEGFHITNYTYQNSKIIFFDSEEDSFKYKMKTGA